MGAYLQRVEWEGSDLPWEIEDLAESPILPPGSERIRLRRDEQYRLSAKIFGTTPRSAEELLPEIGETGIIIPNYKIEGSSHHEQYQYELDHCVVNRVSSKGETLEAGLTTYRAHRKLTPDIGPQAWLTEWYLNAHKGTMLYPRSVQREAKETYSRKREYPEEEVVFDGTWQRAGSRYAFVETPNLAFAVEVVPDELSPEWCRGLSIEYRDEWTGSVPDEETRESIANAVSFIMGRHLIGVGHTSFNNRGSPIEEVLFDPTQPDLVSLCQQGEHPPIRLDKGRPTTLFEDLLRDLVPRYLELADAFELDDVLWGYWLFEELPLGADLPTLATSMEMLKRAWYSSNRSKSRGVYMPKKEFEELLGDELQAVEEKLDGVEYGNRMMNRIRNAFNLGANESMEFFFEELELPIGDSEKSALKARNLMAHGSSALLDRSRDQEMLNNKLAYRTLFNRVLLKLLDYEGEYVDYSAPEWPGRPLEQPLEGRRQ